MFENIIAVPISILLIIFYSHYIGFLRKMETVQTGLTIIAIIVAIPFYFVWMIATRLHRISGFIVWLIGILFLYIATLPASITGGSLHRVNQWSEQKVPPLGIENHIQSVRDDLLEVMVDGEDDDLRYESKEEYREKIRKIPEATKSRLEGGEKVFTYLIAGGLIIAHLQNISIIEANIGGFELDVLLQVYLLIFAVSILYRTTILDLLSYTGDENLDSLEEWDVAFSYQLGIALNTRMNVWMLLMAGVSLFSKVDFGVAWDVLRRTKGKDVSNVELLGKLREERKSRRDD